MHLNQMLCKVYMTPDEPCQKKVELNQNTNHAFSVRLLSSECMGTSRNYIDINISDDM